MDDIADDLGKGFVRAIGWILAEVLFNFVFYWIGWPVCKTVTLGKYPQKPNYDYSHSYNRQGLWCGFTGMVIVILVATYLLGGFK